MSLIRKCLTPLSLAPAGLVAGLIAIGFTAAAGVSATANRDSFRFVILGDRTGEAQPGVFDSVWRAVSAEAPAFVVTVGDTIQGLKDANAEAEWQDVTRMLRPYRRIPVYLTAGNHDIWSDRSAALFGQYAAHPTHYSFDYRQAHFTILDNSRSEQFSESELAFLKADLEAHAAQPLKFIVSHRPSWLFELLFGNPDFPVHRLAKKFGVQYVIAGHVHEMLHADLQGVVYLSMPSAGGHLRASKRYEDGWFFGYTVVEARGSDTTFHIKELKPPNGQGRVTTPADWGKTGLVERQTAARIR